MKDKVIAVSGGASGIGAKVSLYLASEGSHVVIADPNSVQAAANPASIGAREGQAIALGCEIISPEQCETLPEAALRHFGRLDGIVSCAGISKPHEQPHGVRARLGAHGRQGRRHSNYEHQR